MSTLFPGLDSSNSLIKLSVGALVVFGALYTLDSFGVPGMTLVAVIIGVGVLIAMDRDRASGKYDARTATGTRKV